MGLYGDRGSGKAAYKRVYGRFTVYVRTGRLAGLISALVAGTYVRSDSPCYLIYCRNAHADKVVVPILGTTKTDRKRSNFIGIF